MYIHAYIDTLPKMELMHILVLGFMIINSETEYVHWNLENISGI